MTKNKDGKEIVGCIQCGNCCIQCDIRWEEITEKNKIEVMDRLHWLQYHRCETQIMTFPGGRKFGVLRIPLTCIRLDQDKKGMYFCKDYKNRPQLCRKFLCPRALALKQGTPKEPAELAAPTQG